MTTWTTVLYADGVPVVDELSCSDWDAATILAPLVVGWLGGPVSVARAVVASREPEPDAQPSLFDEVAA